MSETNIVAPVTITGQVTINAPISGSPALNVVAPIAINPPQQESWIEMISQAEPVFTADIGSGSVYTLTSSSITRYRFVPEPYDFSLDKVYGAFDGSNLSIELVSRV
jgi:hypothetical protein